MCDCPEGNHRYMCSVRSEEVRKNPWKSDVKKPIRFWPETDDLLSLVDSGIIHVKWDETTNGFETFYYQPKKTQEQLSKQQKETEVVNPKDKISDLEDIFDNLQESNNELRAESTKLKREIDWLRLQVKNATEAADDWRSKVDILQRGVKTPGPEYTTAEAIRPVLEEMLEGGSDLKAITHLNIDWLQRAAYLNDELKAAKHDTEQAMRMLENRQHSVNTLEKKLEDSKSECQTLQNANNRQYEMIQESREKLAEMRQKNHEMDSELCERRRKLHDLSEERRELQFLNNRQANDIQKLEIKLAEATGNGVSIQTMEEPVESDGEVDYRVVNLSVGGTPLEVSQFLKNLKISY